jgi:hypothetical protein
MRVLVGKTFGLGNAVMAIPMLRAIKSLPDVERLDVLIGSTPDDVGAFDVFINLKGDVIDDIHVDNCNYSECVYDVAIMAIPYDGRWRQGIHFQADRVMDGRTRPDPLTDGLVSREKHEIEYQMDNARALGYDGPVRSASFLDYFAVIRNGPKKVYLGVGYKKDAQNQWSVKHWGTPHFVRYVKEVLDKTDVDVVATGDLLDFRFVGKDMLTAIDDDRFSFEVKGLRESFTRVAFADLYVGNDTGMMHVAAAHGTPCIVPFFMDNSITKNRPWGDGHVCIDAMEKDRWSLVDEIVEHTLEKLG